jgi:hypothetical protein
MPSGKPVLYPLYKKSDQDELLISWRLSERAPPFDWQAACDSLPNKRVHWIVSLYRSNEMDGPILFIFCRKTTFGLCAMEIFDVCAMEIYG